MIHFFCSVVNNAAGVVQNSAKCVIIFPYDRKEPEKDMKKTPGEILASYAPGLPDPFYAKLFRVLLSCASIGKRADFVYHFDKKAMKGKQVLILADHASTDSYIWALKGYPFVEPNVVMGYQNILRRGLFHVFLKVGVIPKKLFIPDVSTVRSILRLKKLGASFVLFPEGIQSMDGSVMPTNPATMQLVKKLGLDVVLVTSFGAYLNRPRFDSCYRHGPMEFHYELLFTADELNEMSADELYARYLAKFRYNDPEENARRGCVYRGKHENAYGLDKILFVCPDCGKEFTLKVEGDSVVCSCGRRVRVDERYALIPEGGDFPFSRIDEWFRFGRETVRREVMKEDFSLSYPAEYLTLDQVTLGDDRCVKLGEGTVTLCRRGFNYDGTKNGEHVSITIPIEDMPSAPFVSGTANEFFFGEEYFRFVPKNDPRLSVKVLLAVEELHRLVDPVWRKYGDDVYFR
ncbi:MAG: hypothetical protein J5854_02085 [Clostridia bacterium]|nr:hypothetical protein [Clostridia bacterium]